MVLINMILLTLLVPSVLLTIRYLYRKKRFLKDEELLYWFIRLGGFSVICDVLMWVIENIYVSMFFLLVALQPLGVLIGLFIWYLITRPPKRKRKTKKESTYEKTMSLLEV